MTLLSSTNFFKLGHSARTTKNFNRQQEICVFLTVSSRLPWHSTFCHFTIFLTCLPLVTKQHLSDLNLKFGTKKLILAKLQAFETVMVCVILGVIILRLNLHLHA